MIVIASGETVYRYTPINRCLFKEKKQNQYEF